MKILALDIPEVKLVYPVRHGDERGFFSETFKVSALAEAGIRLPFVQDNHAFSAVAGTVRGLHFQTNPAAQGKLVRVVKGAILDVAVDLRHGSPSFGRHVKAVISASEWNQIYIPVGFAHGLVTLEPNTEVIYKVTGSYSPAHDKGLLWSDPALGIDWGVSADQAILSAKDKIHPKLADLPAYFTYEKDAQG